MSDFKIIWVNPIPKPNQRCNYEEVANFRLCIRTIHGLEPQDFVVRLWTNLYHKENNEGEWHVVNMPYQGVSVKCDNNSVDHLYGTDIRITCMGTFGFNYRAMCKKNKKSQKSDSWGRMEVQCPGIQSTMTEWIQYPMEVQITKNIWVGNHAAAMQATDNGYDALLNAANNAPVFVLQLSKPVLFRKFPICGGAKNVISDKMLHSAVRWLWEASFRCNKVLVFSKYGIARASSLLIAYVYARNPDLTFEDAFKHVDAQHPCFYHRGLKAACTRLYPRG